MCNKDLPEDFIISKIDSTNDCFLCGQEINEIDTEDLSKEFKEIETQIKDTYSEIKNTSKEIKEKEDRLLVLDERI